MGTDDDTDLLGQLQEALRCCDMQHQREQRIMNQFDERLRANDEALRAELQLIMTRSRQRRGLLAEEVADAVFELVGTPRPPPLPNDDLPRMFADNRSDLENYDFDADPMLIGRRQ